MSLEVYKKEIETQLQGLRTGLACPRCDLVNSKEEGATHIQCEGCDGVYCFVCGELEDLEPTIEGVHLDQGGTIETVFVEKLSPNSSYLFRYAIQDGSWMVPLGQGLVRKSRHCHYSY